MLAQKEQFRIKTKGTYPQLVDAEQFGILNRLRARIDRARIGDTLFLGYCKVHKKYYVDHNHTNEEIRCPICDEEWLMKHNIAPRMELTRYELDLLYI